MKKLAITIIAMLTVIVLTACGGLLTENEVQQTPHDGQLGSQNPETTAPQQSEQGQGQSAPEESDAGHEQDTGNDPEQNQYEPEPVHFALKVDGFLIEMDQNIDYVLAALGEPLGVFVAPSCAFDGEDRIFIYSNLEIYTYPVGDDDFVHTISLRDDSIRTTEGGIRLGSSFEDVIAAYGDNYVKSSNMYTFTRDRTTLEIYIEDGIVTSITFGFIIE